MEVEYFQADATFNSMWQTCLEVQLEPAVFQKLPPSEPVAPGECNGPDHGILRCNAVHLPLLTFMNFTDRFSGAAAVALPVVASPARKR